MRLNYLYPSGPFLSLALVLVHLVMLWMADGYVYLQSVGSRVFVAFIMFMKQNSSVSNMNKLMFISFSINMIMIDIYMSYKSHVLHAVYFFGYMYSKSKTDEPLPRNRTIKFISS